MLQSVPRDISTLQDFCVWKSAKVVLLSFLIWVSETRNTEIYYFLSVSGRSCDSRWWSPQWRQASTSTTGVVATSAEQGAHQHGCVSTTPWSLLRPLCPCCRGFTFSIDWLIFFSPPDTDLLFHCMAPSFQLNLSFFLGQQEQKRLQLFACQWYSFSSFLVLIA